MDKIYVVFWTQSGNTQAMAQAVAEGITAAGKTPLRTAEILPEAGDASGFVHNVMHL